MKSLYVLPGLIVAFILGACASIGRPEGGARDEDPPVYVRANPAPGERNVKRTSFSVYFDENVQLEDAFSKVVISPVQKDAAKVSANGHRVTVQLEDTLIPNTTYTIDFADAIKDLNEGNVLDGFALDFSTGPDLDTLRVSGMVLNASNLEPAQGVLVAAYANLDDSAIHTEAPARIARTNQRGQFTIRNLPMRRYRIYALNDLNRDWHWDRSEDVAYLDNFVAPTLEGINITDTLYSSTGGDSLVHRKGIVFLPNDILLSFFNEQYKAQYLKEYKRPDRRHAVVVMGAPADTLPEIRIVDGPADTSLIGADARRWAVPEWRAENDSVSLWISDTTVLATDSLRLSVRYQMPDTADRLVWQTDTLRFFWRDPKRSKKEIEADTVPPTFDKLNIKVGGTQDVYKPLSIEFSEPIASLDTAGVKFEIAVDTLWEALPFVIEPDTVNPTLGRLIRHKWEPGAKYKLTVDSAAIFNIYNEYNKPFKQEFSVKTLDEYANLYFNLIDGDSTVIVELLDSRDHPIRTARPDKNGRVEFRYVDPGTSFARLYFDTDGNGEWSTGRLDSVQPEEVAYFPKKLNLKKNWDIEETWDIYATPLDRQKPYAILKNKPKLKRGEKAPTDPDDEEEEDEFLGPNMGGNRNNMNGNRNNGGNRGGFGGFGNGGIHQSTNDRLRR